jgi:helicase MOV-10
MPLRRMHQAVMSNVNPARLLFPKLEHIKGMPITHADLIAITPINRSIGEDEEQLLTVASILHQPPGSVPFVIFGP